MLPIYPTGFAPPFVAVIVRMYALVKGVAGAIFLFGALPLFRNQFGLSGTDYQTYATICLLPWTMKPLVGAIVDAYPLGGYRKRYYALAATVLGTTTSLALVAPSSPHVSAGLLFGASFAIMALDLVYEGEYASIMAFYGGSSAMPAFVWALVMAGSIGGAVLVGPLGDAHAIRWAFIVAAAAFIQLMYPLVQRPDTSFARDTPAAAAELLLRDTTTAPQTPARLRPQEWILCLAMAASSVVLVGALFTGPQHPWSTLGLATVLCSGLHLWARHAYHNTRLWTCNAFMFIAEACYIDVQGAQDYWYTAGPACVPNGPAFSLALYTSVVSIVSGIIGLIVALLYTNSAGRWSYRTAIQVAIVFQATSCFTDIVLAYRWNRSVLGISDTVFFLLGDAVVSPAASMLKLIPMAILTSKLVQPGKETLTYSLLAGFQNLGQVYAKLCGLALMHTLGIGGPACNFTYYPALLFVSHMLLPLLAATLAYLMVPATPQH